MFFTYTDDQLAALLRKVKTIAIVGAKDKPSPVDKVGRYLIEAGYTIYPVHPARKTVWDLPASKSLLDLPGPVDLVDLFRAPAACPAHAEEVLQLSPVPPVFWMQQGIDSAEARSILKGHPVDIVADRCLMIDLQKLGIGPANE